MHYSAKRGIEIACRPSVTLVHQDHCDVGASGPHRLEILETIARTISPTPSLFIAQSTWSQGNMGKFGETRGGMGKSGVLGHKSDNISAKRKGRGNVTMEGRGPIGTHQRSFEPYHPHPLRLLQDWGFASPSPKKFNQSSVAAGPATAGPMLRRIYKKWSSWWNGAVITDICGLKLNEICHHQMRFMVSSTSKIRLRCPLPKNSSTPALGPSGLNLRPFGPQA